MVTIIRDPDVIRSECYEHIASIIFPDFILRKAGTAALLYKCDNIVGSLFLHWDNQNVTIKGSPSIIWEIANRIELYGYTVIIESPYKILAQSNININPVKSESINTIEFVNTSFIKKLLIKMKNYVIC